MVNTVTETTAGTKRLTGIAPFDPNWIGAPSGGAVRQGVMTRFGKSTVTAALIAITYFVTGWSLPGMPAAPSMPLGTSITMAEGVGHPRVSVTVLPDIDMAIPALAVTVRTAEGRVLAQQTTMDQPRGRQAATVLVPAIGRYVVEITGLPGQWASYPGFPTRQPIDASRFDKATGVAAVTVKIGRQSPDPLAVDTQASSVDHSSRLQAGEPAR